MKLQFLNLRRLRRVMMTKVKVSNLSTKAITNEKFLFYHSLMFPFTAQIIVFILQFTVKIFFLALV